MKLLAITIAALGSLSWPHVAVAAAACGPGPQIIGTTTMTVLSWTGGCVNGNFDGAGILTRRTEFVIGSDRRATDVTFNITYVNGKEVGLTCVATMRTTIPQTTVSLENTCTLAIQGKVPDVRYRKRDDGQWELLNLQGKATQPPLVLAAGSLESMSEKMIADARAGKPVVMPEIEVTTAALDGLVRGAKVTLAPTAEPLGLKQKRVAIVLSAQTLAAVDRLKADREKALADAKKLSSIFEHDYARKMFTESADPDLLLKNLTAAVAKNVGSVIAADDLTVLKQGQADYALVIDWNYSGPGFEMTEAAFDALPHCKDLYSDTCAVILTQTLSGYLIDKDMKAVRRYLVDARPARKEHEEKKNSKADKLQQLAYFFQHATGYSPMNLGGAMERYP